MSANPNVNYRSKLPHRQPPTLLAYVLVPVVLVAVASFLVWLVMG